MQDEWREERRKEVMINDWTLSEGLAIVLHIGALMAILAVVIVVCWIIAKAGKFIANAFVYNFNNAADKADVLLKNGKRRWKKFQFRHGLYLPQRRPSKAELEWMRNHFKTRK